MPIRSDGEGTRKRILDAASSIFAEKGFRGASNQDIARAAGANGASISYYFRDKAGLYLEVWKASQSRSFSIYSAVLEGKPENMGRSALMERLISIMRSVHEWAIDDESIDSLIIFDEMAEETGILGDFRNDMVLSSLMQEMEKLIGNLLDNCHNKLFLQRFLPHVYLSSIRCCYERNASGMGELQSGNILESLLELVINPLNELTSSASFTQTLKSSSSGRKGKLGHLSPQMELGVTDEVAFELKHPTREEIVLQEERIKAKQAELEQEEKEEITFTLPPTLIQSEEQMELFH